MEKKITTIEAAKRIGVSPQAMRGWRFAKRGPDYFNICGRIYYEVEEIDRFIESSKVTIKDTKL